MPLLQKEAQHSLKTLKVLPRLTSQTQQYVPTASMSSNILQTTSARLEMAVETLPRTQYLNIYSLSLESYATTGIKNF